MRVFSSRATLACYLMLLAGYVGGALVPSMNDSAQYAAIALHIFETGDWTDLVAQGKDTTGSPHLLFWLTALSFKFLGVNTFAYKLPPLLFSLLAVYSTSRLGARLYSASVGRLAGVILASAFTFILASNDIRMDTLLTGTIIFATWQLIAFASHGDDELTRRQHLSLGCVGLALGFCTQGIIGIAVPLIAVFLYLTYLCDWRRILDRGWLLLPLLVLFYASPVLYAYLQQFGLEELKTILWPQNLEQITGTQTGHTKHPLFFYYTFLWSFLPWAPLALWAILASVKQLFNDRFWPRARGNALTLGTIVVACTLISLSGFKPHFLNILLPFFAIQLAGWLPTRLTHPKNRRWLWGVQSIIFTLLIVLALVLHGWFFPLRDWQIIGMTTVVLLFGLGFLHRWSPGVRLITVTVCLSAAFYLLLNFNFYPALLTYQAGTTLGNKTYDLRIPHENIYYLKNGGRAPSFDITTARLTPTLSLEALGKMNTPVVLFTSAEGRETIETQGFAVDMLAYSPDYRLARLSRKFLDPNTRAKELRPVYLLRVRPQAPVANVTTPPGKTPKPAQPRPAPAPAPAPKPPQQPQPVPPAPAPAPTPAPTQPAAPPPAAPQQPQPAPPAAPALRPEAPPARPAPPPRPRPVTTPQPYPEPLTEFPRPVRPAAPPQPEPPQEPPPPASPPPEPPPEQPQPPSPQ